MILQTKKLDGSNVDSSLFVNYNYNANNVMLGLTQRDIFFMAEWSPVAGFNNPSETIDYLFSVDKFTTPAQLKLSLNDIEASTTWDEASYTIKFRLYIVDEHDAPVTNSGDKIYVPNHEILVKIKIINCLDRLQIPSTPRLTQIYPADTNIIENTDSEYSYTVRLYSVEKFNIQIENVNVGLYAETCGLPVFSVEKTNSGTMLGYITDEASTNNLFALNGYLSNENDLTM